MQFILGSKFNKCYDNSFNIAMHCYLNYISTALPYNNINFHAISKNEDSNANIVVYTYNDFLELIPFKVIYD